MLQHVNRRITNSCVEFEHFIFVSCPLISVFYVVRFTELYGFEKPNDERALRLMNACASSVLENIGEIVFAYGVSDEYR